jgi:nucleoside-triphosphatase THEP1
VIGMRIGENLLLQPRTPATVPVASPVENSARGRQEFRYSLVWLFSNIGMMVAALALLNYAGIVYWSSFIALVAAVWAIRYKRALRQLTKPGLWLFFVLITMVTAFVFSKVQQQSFQEGLLIGLQMNFRAIVVVMGFSVLGTELYNPVIRSLFLKTSFKQLPAALELSFESLPLMIAQLPDFKTVVRNPVAILNQVLKHGDERLKEIRQEIKPLPKVFLVSGGIGAGKSTFAGKVAELFSEWQLRAGGLLAVRLTADSVTTGYDILDLSNHETEAFLRLGKEPGKEYIGRFSICPEGVVKGNGVILRSLESRPDLLIVDEVGKLELRGDGWSGALQKILENSDVPLLITVREGSEQEVIEKWHITDYEILPVSESDPVRLAKRIAGQLSARG